MEQMAQFFEPEDIQIDDIESTPSILSAEQQEYLAQQETSFQRPQEEQEIQTRAL